MNEGWPLHALSDLARVDRGASWRAEDERTDGTGTPVIRIANTQPGGLDLTDVRSVAGFSPNDLGRATIRQETLLMVGSNGNPDRVGNVYQAEASIVGSVIASFLIGIHPKEGIDHRWLLLCLQDAETQRAISESTAGSTGLKNLSLVWLRSLQVPLPPLAVQRRIVDLMEHLDNQGKTLTDESVALAANEAALVKNLTLRNTDGSLVPLGQVGHFVRGRRFTKQDYVASGLGCIHYGHLHTDLGPVTRSSLKYLPETLRARLRLARPGDVVIAAASEDVAGLGRATVWLGDDDVAVHDDCYIFQHGLDPTFASYIFRSPWFQHQKQRFASGTKVTRISGADLAQIKMPIPALEEQKRIGAVLQQSTETALALREEADALRAFRAALIGRLLSGQMAIPDSYDELLGVAS